MKIENILKKTIPIIAFAVLQSCYSPVPEPIDELKKYNLKNKNLYDSFKKLMENKKYLTSKDEISNAFIDYERSCVYLRKKDEVDKNFKITFVDYGIDGLTKDDEYSDYVLKSLRELNPKAQINLARIYTSEVQKLVYENQTKPKSIKEYNNNIQ